MAVTGTRTVRDICTAALRRAGVTDISQAAEAEDMDIATEALEGLMKSWQGAPWMWTRETASLTLTTAAEYTLDPVRPIQILNARLKRSGIETPMVEMSAREYDELPNKTVTGLPTQFFYDRQREAARLYIWPVLATATGETIEYRYEREIEDIASPNDVIDAPAEWWEPITANLAGLLAEIYERPEPVIQRLVVRAEQKLRDATAGSMTEAVTFMPDCTG